MSLQQRRSRAALRSLPPDFQLPELAVSGPSGLPVAAAANVRKSGTRNIQPAAAVPKTTRTSLGDKENAGSWELLPPPATPSGLLQDSLGRVCLHSGRRAPPAHDFRRELSPGREISRAASLPSVLPECASSGAHKKRLSLCEEEVADEEASVLSAIRAKLCVRNKCTAQGAISVVHAADVVQNLLRATSSHAYKIIDCRYPYEWKGGCIRGSENHWRCDDVRNYLFDSSGEPRFKRSTVILFHCEFSQMRAPDLWRYTRSYDRKLYLDKQAELHGPISPTVASSAPDDVLCYPLCFVLAGGYREFFETYQGQDDLIRGGYVRQEDKQHVHEYWDCEASRKLDFSGGTLRRAASAPSHTPLRSSTKRLRFGDDSL
eukprot:tig00001336_g8228.t1